MMFKKEITHRTMVHNDTCGYCFDKDRYIAHFREDKSVTLYLEGAPPITLKFNTPENALNFAVETTAIMNTPAS